MALFIAMTAIIALPTVSSPAQADKYSDCDSSDPGRAIRGCTRIIKSRREGGEIRSFADYNRGFAYRKKGRV